MCWVLRQQLGDDGLEWLGHIGGDLVQRLRCFVHLLVRNGYGVVASEWGLAPHHFVQHDAQ